MKIVLSFKITILFLLVTGTTLRTFAAEWQWSVEVKSMISSETNAHSRAFLWIPPTCDYVRGVIVGMHNMQEEGIMEHPMFRQKMSELGFAEIWITPGLDPLFDINKGAQVNFDELVHALADVSGYSELAFAPVVPIGHSAYASYPWNFAAWNPECTLALISIHGDAPQTHLTGCGIPNLNWESRTTEGIPGLMVMGEYEWWEERLLPAIIYKNKYRAAPVSLLADAGHGHFDHSDLLIDYLALFIEKAAFYRLPECQKKRKKTELRPIDPSSGWLVDRWHPEQTSPRAMAAPYASYQGDKQEAFWYYDREMALKTEEYYNKARGKKAQYIGFSQNGELLSYDENSHSRFQVKFLPDSDGLTFRIVPVFTDSLRSTRSDEHSWKGNIRFDRINGPVEKINDSTFTVRFYRMGLDNPKRTGDIWLIAHHDGDEKYKSGVQQLNLRIPYRNEEGKEQHITFPPIMDVEDTIQSVSLHATSSSGLPVYYYIKHGPAEIVNNRIEFTQLPPRVKYPVEVVVVAWQYGTSGPLGIKTAQPVENSFLIYQAMK